MEKNKVRIALIGTGSMGKKYARLLQEDKIAHACLSAVVCRSEESRTWAEQNLNQTVQVFRNAQALYEHGDVFDAVQVVTPHKTHPELVMQALSAGKHVLCDKPAGISLLSVKKMNELAESSDRVFAMMFHQRMYQKYRRIKELLEEGTLGRITRVMLVNSRYYRTAHYHQGGSWRSSWNGEGGAALINQGQHLLDIWQWLFGMPQSVYAEIPFGKYNDFEVDDEATVLMTYPDKMTGVFLLTTGESVWEERLEIVGTKGKILLEDNTLTLWKNSMDSDAYGRTTDENSRQKLTTSCQKEEFLCQAEPYDAMLENFASAVLAREGSEKDADSKRMLIAPGTEGAHALELTNAAYLSAWMQEKIQLPLDATAYERELQRKMTEEVQAASEK